MLILLYFIFQAYLLDGVCVSTCPPGYDAQGQGDFDRHCVRTTTKAPVTAAPTTAAPVYTCAGQSLLEDTNVGCRCSGTLLGECRTCSWQLGAPVADSCTMCKNSHYLLDGVCVASCPSGYEPMGSGSFSRYCKPGPSTSSTAPGSSVSTTTKAPTTKASTTTGAPTSSTAPASTTTTPTPVLCAGSSTVETTPEPCRCEANCHRCDWTYGVAGACEYCKNAKYLLDGQCVDSCPVGYTSKGMGNFGRRCISPANRRRAAEGLTLEQVPGMPRRDASIGWLVGVVAASLVVALVGVVLWTTRRRTSVVSDDVTVVPADEERAVGQTKPTAPARLPTIEEMV